MFVLQKKDVMAMWLFGDCFVLLYKMVNTDYYYFRNLWILALYKDVTMENRKYCF